MEYAKIEGQKRAMVISLPACDNILHAFLEKSAVWRDKGSQNSAENQTPIKIVPENQIFGWDSVHLLSVSRINQKMQDEWASQNTFSAQLEEESLCLDIEGEFGCWKIAPGSAGRNLNLILPIRTCTLRQHSPELINHFSNLSASIQVDLWQAACVGTTLSNEASRLRPMVAVLHITGEQPLKTRQKAMLKLAVSHWCHANRGRLLAFLEGVDTLSDGHKSFACMDTQNPDTDQIGILCAEEPDRHADLQRILPMEQSDTLLINQNSAMCQNLLRELPIFRQFPVNELTMCDDRINAEVLLSKNMAAANGLVISIKSCSITFKPQLRVELDICVTLPCGITVHLIINPSLEMSYSAAGVRSQFGENSRLRHYAEIPAGMEVSEAQQLEITEAVKNLASAVLL